MYDPRVARGRWPSILSDIGVPERVLNKRNQECPFCGGKDRFRFTDHNGDGLWVCNQCGSGNGIQFVQRWMNCDFKGAVGKVEQIAPSAYRAPSPKKTNNIEKMRRIWDGSSPVVDGDPVSHYLQARDVWYPPISQQLRYARLPYWQDQQILDTYDCMVARVCDHEGNGVSLHVTYLYHSKKANVASPKKVIAATGSSPRIELFPCEDRLALAEGIETALAVAGSYTTLPAWSTISAGGMEKFECPVRVKYVDIFGDNDANFIGQLASYRLAHRLRASGKEVRVFIPADIGKDWADG